MITGGVSKDMGGLAMGTSGLIFIYDASVGGNGATQILFDKLEDSIKRASSLCPILEKIGRWSKKGGLILYLVKICSAVS